MLFGLFCFCSQSGRSWETSLWMCCDWRTPQSQVKLSTHCFCVNTKLRWNWNFNVWYFAPGCFPWLRSTVKWSPSQDFWTTANTLLAQCSPWSRTMLVSFQWLLSLWQLYCCIIPPCLTLLILTFTVVCNRNDAFRVLRFLWGSLAGEVDIHTWVVNRWWMDGLKQLVSPVQDFISGWPLGRPFIIRIAYKKVGVDENSRTM